MGLDRRRSAIGYALVMVPMEILAEGDEMRTERTLAQRESERRSHAAAAAAVAAFPFSGRVMFLPVDVRLSLSRSVPVCRCERRSSTGAGTHERQQTAGTTVKAISLERIL